jgi:hypothetical protein
MESGMFYVVESSLEHQKSISGLGEIVSRNILSVHELRSPPFFKSVYEETTM